MRAGKEGIIDPRHGTVEVTVTVAPTREAMTTALFTTGSGTILVPPVWGKKIPRTKEPSCDVNLFAPEHERPEELIITETNRIRMNIRKLVQINKPANCSQRVITDFLIPGTPHESEETAPNPVTDDDLLHFDLTVKTLKTSLSDLDNVINIFRTRSFQDLNSKSLTEGSSSVPLRGRPAWGILDSI